MSLEDCKMNGKLLRWWKIVEIEWWIAGTNLEPDRLAWRVHCKNRLYNWGVGVLGAHVELQAQGKQSGRVAPTKVKSFTWLVARRACLTHEAL